MTFTSGVEQVERLLRPAPPDDGQLGEVRIGRHGRAPPGAEILGRSHHTRILATAPSAATPDGARLPLKKIPNVLEADTELQARAPSPSRQRQ